MNNEEHALFQVLFVLYSGACDKNFGPDARYKFFGMSI
jgi:hypothetical protein